MKYFTTRIPFLIPSYGIDPKETEKMDKFLQLIERSGALAYIPDKYSNNGSAKRL